MITFGPNDTTAEIAFNLTDDTIALENTERLMWSLELVAVSSQAFVRPHNSVTILILDDDGVYVATSMNLKVQLLCACMLVLRS